MTSQFVKKILERGWDRVDTGGKHSGLLNAMYLTGFHDWFHEKIKEVLDAPVITHPNIADSSSRIRPLVLAKCIEDATKASKEFHTQRVVSGGVTQHTTAKSTAGWVFADTAYMVAPSQAIMGNFSFAFSELKGFHRILAQEDGLLRHVFNASVPVEESYIKIDLWIDGTAWGRASAWWVAGVVDSFEVIPPPEWDSELVAMYQKTARRLIECQDQGFFRSTIDDPYAPIDTSATVMIAYAFEKAYQLGLGDIAEHQAAVKALESVLREHVEFDTGILKHQQFGPMVVNIPSQNPRYLDAGNAYGQAFLAALFALIAEGVKVRDLDLKALSY
jgi:unsaturated rhamnogalacturonyl hydrolase